MQLLNYTNDAGSSLGIATSAEALHVRDRTDSRRVWLAFARGGPRGDPGGRKAISPRSRLDSLGDQFEWLTRALE